MKKVLLTVVFFLASLTFFCWVFFPYDTVVKQFVSDAVQKNKIPVHYAEIVADRNHTVLTGVQLTGSQPLSIGQIEIEYGLLSMVSKAVDVRFSGKLLNGDVSVSPSTVIFNLILGTEFLPGRGSVSGDVLLKGEMALAEDTGVFNIRSPKIIAKSDFGPLTFTDIDGEGTYQKKVLTISKVQSSGKNKLSLNGKVFVNSGNFNRSRLQLKGDLNFSGLKKKVSIKGTIGRPSVQLK